MSSNSSTKLPTLRDLVSLLARWTGVEGCVLVGRDGLLIEFQGRGGLDGELLAAHIPTLAAANEELGAHCARGAMVTSVVEYERGTAVVTALTDDVLLFLLLDRSANLSPILFELRRHRSNIAALV